MKKQLKTGDIVKVLSITTSLGTDTLDDIEAMVLRVFDEEDDSDFDLFVMVGGVGETAFFFLEEGQYEFVETCEKCSSFIVPENDDYKEFKLGDFVVIKQVTLMENIDGEQVPTGEVVDYNEVVNGVVVAHNRDTLDGHEMEVRLLHPAMSHMPVFVNPNQVDLDNKIFQ